MNSSIDLTMKTFLSSLILCIGLIGMVHAQSNSVTFLPGLGEPGTIWTDMSTQLQQQYMFNDRFEDFNGFNAMNTAANSIYIPNGNVIIGHSQGGLVGREYIRDRSPGNFNALISVGTPHTGAPVVDAIQNGNARKFFEKVLNDLALGFLVALGPGSFKSQIISTLQTAGIIKSGAFGLQTYLQTTFTSQPGVLDMKPNSYFITQLNSQPNNTLPAARYAIYGAEYFHTPWRLMGSLIAGQGEIENDIGIDAHNVLEGFYGSVMFTAIATAEYYRSLRDRARDNFNFTDFFRYQELYYRWARIAYAFKVGYDSLHFGQQYLWSTYITGSRISPSTWYAEDGFFSAPTQAPSFFGTLNDQRLRAEGANHLEETAHPNVKKRLNEVFKKSDVNIPEVGEGDGGSLTATINGVPYANDGQTLSFSANVSNADGSVSYQWYYRRETYSPWTASGTGSTFQYTFYSAPGGETAHSAVKLEVTSAGETASDVHSVDVYGCPNGYMMQGDSLKSNIIIPC